MRCIACFLVFFAFSVAICQEIPLYGGMGYTHCYVHHATPISEAPPFSASMPLEVFQSYFVLDSLSKLALPTKPELLIKAANEQLTNDNLDSLLKYTYMSLDYDPVRFLMYLALGDYLQPRYVNRPTSIFHTYRPLAIKRLGGPNNPILYITFTHAIFYVEITATSIDSAAKGFSGGSPLYEPIVCCTAKVLKPMKGASIMEFCSSDEEGGDPFPCIRFSYGLDWTLGAVPSSDNRTTGVSTSGADKTSKTTISGQRTYRNLPIPAPGMRYIVFLDIDLGSMRDPYGIPFNLYPMRVWEQAGGLFPVINGEVADEFNYFGYGTSTEISKFEDKLFETIRLSILNR